MRYLKFKTFLLVNRKTTRFLQLMVFAIFICYILPRHKDCQLTGPPYTLAQSGVLLLVVGTLSHLSAQHTQQRLTVGFGLKAWAQELPTLITCPTPCANPGKLIFIVTYQKRIYILYNFLCLVQSAEY